MQQKFIRNTEYEILTPNGWEDFEGIFKNESALKKSKLIKFSNNTQITATDEHRFFKNGEEIEVNQLKIGDKLVAVDDNTVIISLTDIVLKDTYDVFNATNHVILANGINSHQCDEFAFVQPNIATEFWTSLSPTLSTGGKCLITSTPNSSTDQFADIWKQSNKTIDEYGNETDVGINGFKSFLAHWNEHPDRDEKWAETERGKIGEEKFLREFECQFIAYDETLINSVFLSTLATDKLPFEKIGEVRFYEPIVDGKLYIVALDPSLGTGGDNAAIQVLSLPDLKQVAEWQNNTTPIRGQIRILKNICDHINKNAPSSEIYWSVENNNIGEAALVIISEMGEENIKGVFLNEPKRTTKNAKVNRKGFTTTHLTKLSACAKLKQWIETNKMILSSKNVINELKSFIASGTSFKAKIGETDDLVMALILAVRMIQVVSKYDESTFDQIRENFADDDDEYDMPMPVGFL